MWFLADPGYTKFLSSIKQRIQQAQVKAALAVNQELLLLYMRRFANEYGDLEIVQAPLAQIHY